MFRMCYCFVLFCFFKKQCVFLMFVRFLVLLLSHFDEFCMKTFQHLGKCGKLIIMAFISKCVKGKYSHLNALSCILTYDTSVFITPCLLLMHCTYLTSTFPWFHQFGVSNFPVDLGNPRSDWNKTPKPLIAGGTFFLLDLSHLHAPDPISLKSPGAFPSSNVALCQMLPEDLISCESCICGNFFLPERTCAEFALCHSVGVLQQHTAMLFPEPYEAFFFFFLKNLTRTQLNPILKGVCLSVCKMW